MGYSSPTYYGLFFQFINQDIRQNTSYYFGNMPKVMSLDSAFRTVLAFYAGTIEYITINGHSNVPAITADPVRLSILLTGSAYSIGDIYFNNEFYYEYFKPNIPIVEGEQIEFLMETPNWGSDVLGSAMGLNMLIRQGG